jgi:hypothetical protein
MVEVSTNYVVGGRRLPLYPLDTVRFISYKAGVDLNKLKGKIGASKDLAIDAGFPQPFVVVRGDVEALQKLHPNPDLHEIACTRAAFRDKHGHEVILTDDVLVKLRKKIPKPQLEELLRKYGIMCKFGDKPEKGDIWRLRVLDPREDAPLLLANRLSEDKDVVYAESDALQAARRAQEGTPQQVQIYGPEWRWHIKMIQAEAAWAYLEQINQQNRQQGLPEPEPVRVVVHDCGVDDQHPDLEYDFQPGCHFDDPYVNVPSNRYNAHGTACAGIIGAKPGNDPQGVVGVAPNCRLVPLRATKLTWSEWAETFHWAARQGRIISCSWSISENQTAADAIRQVVQQGGVIFCAVGNDGKDEIFFPANLPGVIAVGASTDQDERAAYSNSGPELDILAPSSGGQKFIATTDIRGFSGYNPYGKYTITNDEKKGFGGTSAATPLAAGVAALMLGVNPNLTVDQVRRILCETAESIGTDPYDRDDVYDRQIQRQRNDKYGFGRINAFEAIKMAYNLSRGQ